MPRFLRKCTVGTASLLDPSSIQILSPTPSFVVGLCVHAETEIQHQQLHTAQYDTSSDTAASARPGAKLKETPPTEVTTGLAPGGEQCISPERRRQGDGAPGGPQEAPRAAGRQRKSPRRGRPTGQQRSRRTHHHHRFRRPARREQPADGVHWAHYPRECVRSQTPREQVPVTQADIFYQPPQGAGGRTGGITVPPVPQFN